MSAQRRSGCGGCFALVTDVWRGGVLGDFARELGLVGVITQILFGFVPVLGTLCALRDAWADWRHRDWPGFWLNILAFVPFFGGFAKLIAVLMNVRRVGAALFVRKSGAGASAAS